MNGKRVLKEKHGMIYLDNAATTRPFEEVIRETEQVMRRTFGNPSAVHQLGVEAEEKLEASRKAVADSLQVSPDEVFFTSGGTETNNLVLKGIGERYARKGKHLVATAVEHKSVLNVLRAMENQGYEVTYIPVDRRGIIDLEALKQALREDTLLVSVMHVNNETGAVQPIDGVADILRNQDHPPLLHVDAVQSFGKIPVHPKQSRVDLLTVSSHKIHGPKGIGAFYKQSQVDLKPLIDGGGQEKGLRSGTENLPAIAGFARAVELNFEDVIAQQNHMHHLKELLREQLHHSIPDAVVNTPDDPHAAPHVLNVSFPGVKGEVLVRQLESAGIYASTGSACTSSRESVSHVLKAMGLAKDQLEGAMRFSFSSLNREEEPDQLMEKLVPAVKRLRRLGNIQS